MAICSRCGNEIEFRYIDGRCIPLHLYGSGCGGSARSDVNDYPGYRRSKESTCFLTRCPECQDEVYFIRHNGGSVWIDPPLGPPWYKHPCMDFAYVAAKGIRHPIISESALAKFKQCESLIIGIVKEAEASWSKRYSLINIETGRDTSIVLLMKNNAGFLVGRLVIYDQRGKSVSWVEDDSYRFNVIARIKPRLVKPAAQTLQIECPECLSRVAAGDIAEHLKRQHQFPWTIDLDSVPDRRPVARIRNDNRRMKVKAASFPICPNPARWDDAFQQLVRYAETRACRPSRPPPPLILAGWSHTSDNEKMQRWNETVDWASANGCRDIVEGIAHQDFYRVEKLTSAPVGPCYRPWDFEAKVRPPDEELAIHLEHLSVHWAEIAGSHLSPITRPLGFTGKKARRLLVHAEDAATPPWGGWSFRSPEEAERRTFTRFRAAVNQAIRPHEVDHIAFVSDVKTL